MTESSAPTPASAGAPSASGIFTGIGLVGLLHLAVSLAVVIIGDAVARDGFYAVFGFWLVLGLFQWIYLYPAIRWTRSRGWPGVVFGIWIAGGTTVALNLLQLGAALLPVALETLTGSTGLNVTYSATDRRVVSTDPAHIVVRANSADAAHPGPEETETFFVDTGTRFDFRGPAWRQQSRPAGIIWLKPGRQVGIDYVIRNRQKQATLVTIWVESLEP